MLRRRRAGRRAACAVSNVVAASNPSTGAPVGKRSRRRWSGARLSSVISVRTNRTSGATVATTTSEPIASMSPRDREPLHTGRVTRALDVRRDGECPRRVGVGVVGIAPVDAVFDREEPLVGPAIEQARERSVGVGADCDLTIADLAPVVDDVGYFGGRLQREPAASERRNVARNELDVESAHAGQEAHAGWVGARDQSRRLTVDFETTERGHGERVEVEAADAQAPRRRPVERHPHHIGARSSAVALNTTSSWASRHGVLRTRSRPASRSSTRVTVARPRPSASS